MVTSVTVGGRKGDEGWRGVFYGNGGGLVKRRGAVFRFSQ